MSSGIICTCSEVSHFDHAIPFFSLPEIRLLDKVEKQEAVRKHLIVAEAEKLVP